VVPRGRNLAHRSHVAPDQLTQICRVLDPDDVIQVQQDRSEDWRNRYGLSYALVMADVVTTGQAREALHQIARRFEAGDDNEPLYFGSHRRAQAVIVPIEMWERLLEAAEDEVDLTTARKRTGRLIGNSV
jgi:antitoxin StbD